MYVCGPSVCTPRQHDCYIIHLLSKIRHGEWKDVHTVLIQHRSGVISGLEGWVKSTWMVVWYSSTIYCYVGMENYMKLHIMGLDDVSDLFMLMWTSYDSWWRGNGRVCVFISKCCSFWKYLTMLTRQIMTLILLMSKVNLDIRSYQIFTVIGYVSR